MFIDPQALATQDTMNAPWAREKPALTVIFHKQLVENEKKQKGWTEEYQVVKDDGSIRIETKRMAGTGRPMWDEEDYIRIHPPGDRTLVIDRKVTEEDKITYSKQWEQYQRQETQTGSGTPLSEWPSISRAQAQELKHFHISTVEQLAETPDVQGQKFPGFSQLKTRAKDFLAAAQNLAPLAELRSQIEERDSKLSSLQEQLKEVRQQMEVLAAQKVNAPPVAVIEESRTAEPQRPQQQLDSLALASQRSAHGRK